MGEPSRLPLVLTMGEPAGVGGEITLAAWQTLRNRRRNDAQGGGQAGSQAVAAFFVVDDPARLERLATRGDVAVPIREITAPEQAEVVFDQGLPVLPLEHKVWAIAGQPDPANGQAVISSIDRAVELVQAGRAGGMVTNPIQKSALYAAGFRHPGHTEYLAHLAGLKEPPVMMLAGGGLRVVLVTVHMALRDAVKAVTAASILHVGRITAAALKRDFGIRRPRMAVAALNPHAGESGTMGKEEEDVISPGVAALRAVGIDASGPHPADTLFHAEARARYDVVLCMYHDQGLIPLKTIAFDSGVNISLGLPFVRTSPDHGTALNIAGTGRASPNSLLAAIEIAGQMEQARRKGDPG